MVLVSLLEFLGHELHMQVAVVVEVKLEQLIVMTLPEVVVEL